MGLLYRRLSVVSDIYLIAFKFKLHLYQLDNRLFIVDDEYFLIHRFQFSFLFPDPGASYRTTGGTDPYFQLP